MADEQFKERIKETPEARDNGQEDAVSPEPSDPVPPEGGNAPPSPDDAPGLDDVGGDERGVGDGGEEQALASPTEEEGHEPAIDEKEVGRVKGGDEEGGLDDLASEDLGLSITDDELWDEGGGLDEIPLFDELDKDDEGATKGGDGKAAHVEEMATPEGPGADTAADEAQSVEKGKAQPVTVEPQGGEGSQQIEDEGQERGSHPLFDYVPFIFSGLNLILFIVGLVVLVNLLTSPQAPPVKAFNKGEAVKARPSVPLERGKSPLAVKGQKGPSEAQGSRGGFYTMTLDPFIIPAQLNGELVFFKLKAELVFDDVASKRAFSQRESALRDIIYSELKGIDITEGLSNKNLFSYRRPIMERLNEYFAPHRVTDIRLVGFVLK